MDFDESVDLEGLTRAWERVRVPETRENVPEDTLRADLARFIRNASAAGGMYDLLAMKTRGSRAEGRFRSLAAQEMDSEKRLQAEFFMLTGDTCPVPTVRPSAPSVAGAVRGSCLAEMDNSRQLEKCAKTCGDAGAAALLLELSQREKIHAGALRHLLELMI